MPQPGHAHAADHAHDGEHDHPPYLAHHWDSPKQQFEAGKLGMWLFLATEVLLFGGLFVGYSVLRHGQPELFKWGSQFLDTTMGATNTVVLILSSLTMAWGVTAAQKNQIGLLKICLLLTLAGAATFMVIKYFEYTHKFHLGIYPGAKFYESTGSHGSSHAVPAGATEHAVTAGTDHDVAAGPATDHSAAAPAAADHAAPASPESAAAPATAAAANIFTLPGVESTQIAPAPVGPDGLAPHAELIQQPFEMENRHAHGEVNHISDPNRPANAHRFFNIYFMMTGLHGIHVLVGMVVITWLLIRTQRGHFSAEYFTPIDLGGLYWHIVDLIWIFLFPLFYLI